MRQKTYHIEDRRLLRDTLDRIRRDQIIDDPDRTFFLIHESFDKAGSYSDDIEAIRDAFPHIRSVGMTMIAPLNKWMNLPAGLSISVFTFETSSFSIFRYDCAVSHPAEGKSGCLTPEEAADAFSKELEKIPDAKGVLYLSSGSDLDPDRFLFHIDSRFDGIPIFGTQAGASIQSDSSGRSSVFMDGKSYCSSIIVVVFHGSDLHIKTGYSFGWRPLGREMTITEVSSDGRNISKIDGQAALDIYYKYLHIVPDDNFYSNVCAFPFVIHVGKQRTSRVPLHYEKGAISFSTTMRVGDKVSLSYSKEMYLMKETLDMANDMLRFHPQAMYASVCVNRRIFMGNVSADREISFCRNACPALTYASGYGEILRQNGDGGFLNSTLVTAAFREGNPEDTPEVNQPLGTEYMKQNRVSLSERLVTFLEATTRELRDTIHDLEKLASHDSMTGIYNRMTTENLLESLLEDALEKDDDLTVMLFDIDAFKSINDTYGHQVGDHVIVRISEIASSYFDSDVAFGRWGGDEFLCIFPGRTGEEVYRLAEKIRLSVRMGDFSPVRRISISLGIAPLRPLDTPHDIIMRVDRALYHSKHSGRNRASVYRTEYKDELLSD